MVVIDPAQSDEESTKTVMRTKPVLETQVSESMEEDMWWQMNQDFARDVEEEEFYVSTKKAVAQPMVQRDFSSTPTLDDNEWMALNEDFARDDNHMEIEEQAPVTKKYVPSIEASYGDYGVWWE